MSQNPHRSNIVESHEVTLLCSGGNGANLTVAEGKGATVPRDGEGVYTITLPWNPGVFKGAQFQLGAATPGDLKGYSVVRDTPVAFDGTSWTLSFTVFNASVTAADLLVNEYIDITLKFGIGD